jgi:ABC-type Fe3+ transport system substrate-binding protein
MLHQQPGRARGQKARSYRRSWVGVIAVVVVAVAAFTASASGSSSHQATSAAWSAVLTQAKSEGSATAVVTDTPQWQTAEEGLFKKTYGLNMAVAASGSNGDLETRLEAEEKSGAPQTDVYEDVAPSFFVQHKSWFVNLAQAGLPNFSSYPKKNVFQNLCINEKLDVTGFTYNTKLIPASQVPHTWKQLLNSNFKEKVVLSRPLLGGYYMEWALIMRQAFGPSYLENLAKLDPILDDSSVSAAEVVASGAAAISFPSQVDSASALIQAGAPLKFVLLTNPDVGSAGCVGIVKNGPHPAAAKVLLNMLMTSASQAAACKAGVPLVSPLNAPGCYKIPASFQFPKFNSQGLFPGLSNTALQNTVLKELGISGA